MAGQKKARHLGRWRARLLSLSNASVRAGHPKASDQYYYQCYYSNFVHGANSTELTRVVSTKTYGCEVFIVCSVALI